MRLLDKKLSNSLRDSMRALLQSLEFLTILPISNLSANFGANLDKKKATDRRAKDAKASLATTATFSHFFWLERHGWSANLCGLFIGSVCSLCAVVCSFVLPNFPSFLVACLTLGSSMILSGALHEDGLADTTDALGVAKERRLSVMESPEVGSFAVLALILSFTIRVAALTFLLEESLKMFVVSLLLLHSSARSSFPLWLRFGFRFEFRLGLRSAGSMSTARLARAIGKPSLFSVFSPLLLCGLFSFVFLPFFAATIFLLVFVLCSVCLLMFFAKFFKGVSGDLCGFGEQVLESVLILALCAIMLG